MMNDPGGFAAPAPTATAKTPKSAPGDGLKKFLTSGALDALLAPQSLPPSIEEPQESDMHLMDFLRMLSPVQGQQGQPPGPPQGQPPGPPPGPPGPMGQ